MTVTPAAATKPKTSLNQFDRSSVTALQDAHVPFLIGGAYVVEAYAGVSRRTKDFDLYVRPNHVRAALDALACAGYETELTLPHWLAKAKRGRNYVDLIFRAGNGLCEVDNSWFERANDDQLLGLHVKLCAPEERIWMKAFIMERVLLSHVSLFGYIYPTEQARIPKSVMEDLTSRLREERSDDGQERLCRGTLLSRKQYLVDVHSWGFRDARLEDRVHMSSED